jgi:hypothetical protein
VSQISSNRASAAVTSGAGPADRDPAQLHLRQADGLRQAPNVNDRTSSRASDAAARRTRRLELVVDEDFVGDDRHAVRGADRRQPVELVRLMTEPVRIVRAHDEQRASSRP